MSAPPVDLRRALENPALRNEHSIMVNVGELRKLVQRITWGDVTPPPTDDLDASAAEPLRLADVDVEVAATGD